MKHDVLHAFMLYRPSSLALLVKRQDRHCKLIILIHAIGIELIIFVDDLRHGVVEYGLLVTRIYQRFRHLTTRGVAARD